MPKKVPSAWPTCFVCLVLGVLGPTTSAQNLSSVLVDGDEDLRPLIDLQGGEQSTEPLEPLSTGPVTDDQQSSELPPPEPIATPRPVQPSKDRSRSSGRNTSQGRKVDLQRNVRLGISFSPDEQGASGQGLKVLGVIVGGPAEQAGLRPGDRILEANDQSTNSPEDLVAAIENRSAVGLVVVRNGRRGRLQADLDSADRQVGQVPQRAGATRQRLRNNSRFPGRGQISRNPAQFRVRQQPSRRQVVYRVTSGRTASVNPRALQPLNPPTPTSGRFLYVPVPRDGTPAVPLGAPNYGPQYIPGDQQRAIGQGRLLSNILGRFGIDF